MKKIKISIILEMLGRPKEHLEETLNKLVEALGKEKGIKISNKKVHEAKELENKDKNGKIVEVKPENQLYTSFAEIEMDIDDLNTLIIMTFKYMPAHIEIVSPAEFNINNFEVTGLLNEITARLHHYDAIAKSALMNNKLIAGKLQEVIAKTGYKEEDSQENYKPESKESENQEENKKSKKKSK
jgi:hypothetical protein